MVTRIVLSIACVFLLAAKALPQTSTTPDSNLYLKALSACVEKQGKDYGKLGLERDYTNRIVEYNLFLTPKLPTQIGEYRIEYLNGKAVLSCVPYFKFVAGRVKFRYTPFESNVATVHNLTGGVKLHI